MRDPMNDGAGMSSIHECLGIRAGPFRSRPAGIFLALSPCYALPTSLVGWVSRACEAQPTAFSATANKSIPDELPDRRFPEQGAWVIEQEGVIHDGSDAGFVPDPRAALPHASFTGLLPL